MTFTEAAAEVLRQTGKPMHFKDITQMAIEKNLLSHVGKTPDVTMGARLSLQIKKEPDGEITRVKPGVFGLREWEHGGKKKKKVEAKDGDDRAEERAEGAGGEEDDATADQFAALASEVDAADEREHARRDEPRGGQAAQKAPAYGLGDDSPGEDDEQAPIDEEERMRGQLAASATDLFEEEEDDDQPLFGGPEPAPSSPQPTGEGGRRRRRRRRRGKRGDDQQMSGSGSFAPAPRIGGGEEDDDEETIGVTIGDEGDAQPTRRAIVLERVPSGPSHVGGRGRGQDFRSPQFQRAGDQPRRNDNVDLTGSLAFDSIDQLDEMVGRDLADVVQAIVGGTDRSQGPVPLRAIAEAAQRRGKLSGDPQTATSAIAAAVRGDNLRRASHGQRPRFRFAQGGRVGLTDWVLGPELIRFEQDAHAAVDRYRDAARRALASKLQKDMSGPALVELLFLVLERMGFREIKPVRRAGLPGGESHFSALHPTGGDEIRTAIVLRRDGREIGRERVIDLRGSLHHYGPANAGWLITTGQVLSGAREEASAPGTIPIALYDSLAFAQLLEKHDVAVVKTRIELPLPDVELLETLRGI